jgi:hypothetical protein
MDKEPTLDAEYEALPELPQELIEDELRGDFEDSKSANTYYRLYGDRVPYKGFLWELKNAPEEDRKSIKLFRGGNLTDLTNSNTYVGFDWTMDFMTALPFAKSEYGGAPRKYPVFFVLDADSLLEAMNNYGKKIMEKKNLGSESTTPLEAAETEDVVFGGGGGSGRFQVGIDNQVLRENGCMPKIVTYKITNPQLVDEVLQWMDQQKLQTSQPIPTDKPQTITEIPTPTSMSNRVRVDKIPTFKNTPHSQFQQQTTTPLGRVRVEPVPKTPYKIGEKK